MILDLSKYHRPFEDEYWSVNTDSLRPKQIECLEEMLHNRIEAQTRGTVGWILNWQYPTETPIPKWITIRSLIKRNIVTQICGVKRIVFSAHKEDKGLCNDELTDIRKELK